jgi:hypothetical protein
MRFGLAPERLRPGLAMALERPQKERQAPQGGQGWRTQRVPAPVPPVWRPAAGRAAR